ncbi:hypothetical protein CMV16_03090 [Peribacillus simplex]|nr:hypothetical protein CMV16_03090 [Peribacillus simplex]
MDLHGEYGVLEVTIYKRGKDFTSKGKSPMTTKELAAIQKRLKHLLFESLISYLIKFIIILIQPKNANHNGTLNKVPHINPFKKAIGTSIIKIPLNKVAFFIIIAIFFILDTFYVNENKKRRLYNSLP